MRKDIHIPKVEDIAVSIIKESSPDIGEHWNAYLLNLKDKKIEGVLITSKGYGIKDGERVKTSTMRHFKEVIKARDYMKIELISEDVLGLSNEFWVSFYLDGLMHDKKYVFVAETLSEENFVEIPILNKPGVMII